MLLWASLAVLFALQQGVTSLILSCTPARAAPRATCSRSLLRARFRFDNSRALGITQLTPNESAPENAGDDRRDPLDRGPAPAESLETSRDFESLSLSDELRASIRRGRHDDAPKQLSDCELMLQRLIGLGEPQSAVSMTSSQRAMNRELADAVRRFERIRELAIKRSVSLRGAGQIDQDLRNPEARKLVLSFSYATLFIYLVVVILIAGIGR